MGPAIVSLSSLYQVYRREVVKRLCRSLGKSRSVNPFHKNAAGHLLPRRSIAWLDPTESLTSCIASILSRPRLVMCRQPRSIAQFARKSIQLCICPMSHSDLEGIGLWSIVALCLGSLCSYSQYHSGKQSSVI